MANQDRQIILLAEAAGGVMRHVIDLYNGLKAKDHDVKMVLSPLRIEARYLEELNDVDRDDISYVAMRRAPHPSDIGALLAVQAILKQRVPKAILHTHSTKAGIIGSFMRPHVHATIHTPHAYRGTDPTLRGPGRALVEKVESSYSKRYDRVVAEVPLEAAHALKLGVRPQNLRLIPNGVDISTASFEQIFERRKTLPSRPTLGFIGRLVHQKNPLLFVELLNEVIRRGCDVQAIVLGDGPLRAAMVNLATSYGLLDRIDWRGEFPARGLYPEMDLLVHTSFYEALPYSLIEATAALLPIVAVRNPGSEAILGQRLSQNLSEQSSAKGLASIVIRILNDAQLRLDQLKLCREIALDYSTEQMIRNYEHLYNEL